MERISSLGLDVIDVSLVAPPPGLVNQRGITRARVTTFGDGPEGWESRFRRF
jgi:hypothetical protein